MNQRDSRLARRRANKPDANTKGGQHPGRGDGLVLSVILMDLLIAALSLSLSWWLRFRTPLAEFGVPVTSDRTFVDYLGHILFGSVLMVLTLANYRVYEFRRLRHAAHEAGTVFKAVVVWFAIYLSLSLILKFQPPISRIYCLSGAVCLVVFLICWRLVVSHLLIPRYASRFPTRRLLLIGWNDQARQLATHLAEAKHPEFELCGLITRDGGPAAALEPAVPEDLEVLGSYAEFETLLKRQRCESVLVADPGLVNGRLSRIAVHCEKEIIDFQVIPSGFQTFVSGLSLQSINGVPVLAVSRLPLHRGLNTCIKRLIDIFGALVGLAIAAPMMIVFGYLIRRESPGPVIFRQRRQGLDGRTFEMYKLRSMKLGAELESKATVKNDPRRLKIGKFMRSWNIDELPQFWNVLKGDMSLVGPRPEVAELIGELKEIIPHYNARHNVKPGMTGWAQVKGLRGDTDLKERIRSDLWYIENWNLLFDLRILVMTFLTTRGAS